MSRSLLRRSVVLALLVLVLATALAGTLASATSHRDDSRAVVAFHKAETDDVVASFVHRNDLRLDAAYLWTAGFSGTHRTYSEASAEQLLASARRETVTLFTNAETSSFRQIADFARAFAASEIAASAALTSRARALLNNHVQVGTALSSSRSGAALVYAIEVVGAKAEQLNRVSSDSLVSAVATKGGGKVGGLLKPAPYQAVSLDPATYALPAGQLREVMVSIIRGAVGGQR